MPRKRTNPEHAALVDRLIQQGRDLLETGDCDAAIEAVRGALRIAPMRADAKELLSIALESRVESSRHEAAARPVVEEPDYPTDHPPRPPESNSTDFERALMPEIETLQPSRPAPDFASAEPSDATFDPLSAVVDLDLNHNLGHDHPMDTRADDDLSATEREPYMPPTFGAGETDLEASGTSEWEPEPYRTTDNVRVPGWLSYGVIAAGLLVIIGMGSYYFFREPIDGMLVKVREMMTPEHVLAADRLLKEAREKLGAGDLVKAADSLERAIEKNPAGSGQYQPLLGEVYLLLGEKTLGEVDRDEPEGYEQALELFRNASRVAPELAGAWYQVGYCRYRLARHARSERKDDQAIRLELDAAIALERAVELKPNHLASMALMGQVYSKLASVDSRNRAKAVNVWYTIIENWPNEPDARKAKLELRSRGYPSTRPE